MDTGSCSQHINCHYWWMQNLYYPHETARSHKKFRYEITVIAEAQIYNKENEKQELLYVNFSGREINGIFDFC